MSRQQRFGSDRTERSMLLVAENGMPGLDELYAKGRLPPYPLDF